MLAGPLDARTDRRRLPARAGVAARAVSVLAALLLAALTVACRSGNGGDGPNSGGPNGGGPNAGGRGQRPIEAGPTTTLSAEDAALPAFYRAPEDLAEHRPGDVLRVEVVDVDLDGVTAWRVLYRSQGVDGQPAAVSGLVVAPTGPAPEPRPVLAFAHGTTGIGDDCAPSRRLAEGAGTLVDRVQLSALAGVASSGWVVSATDYEGLGTASVHPYGVGDSAGRAVLDSLRAAQRLPETGATPVSPTMIWGHSQGGGAALFASELAAGYAPELRVVGAVASAPAAELATLTEAVLGGPNLGLGILTAVGFAAAYPQLDLDSILTPAGRALAARARTSCVEAIAREAAGSTADRYLAVGPTQDPTFAALLEQNSPGRRPSTVPVLVAHGEADELVPVGISAALVGHMCDVGATVHRVVYPGADHASVVISSLGDVVSWLGQRLAGAPAQTDC